MMLQLLAQANPADTGLMSQVQSFFSFVIQHWQFCTLHFLQFAIWGAWFVVLGNLLNARGFARKDIGRIYGCIPIGSMITPLIVGPLADKYFNTEYVIGVSHLIGGVLLFAMARAKNPRPFYWLTLVYALAFAPTLNLVNSIVFAHDADLFNGTSNEFFPWIRVFGTIGWIVAGLSHAILLKKDEPVNEKPLLLAGTLSIVLAVFSFVALPETKPKTADAVAAAAATDAAAEVAAADAVADPGIIQGAVTSFIDTLTGSVKILVAEPVFFGVTLVAAMAMGLYFAFAALFLEKTGVPARTVGPTMTIGQWIEIFFMLSLPWFLGEGNKNMNWVLLVGISAWAIRFGLFAVGRPMALVLFGVAIHGICFDFFFAAGMINANIIAPAEFTATAQGIYGFLVYGLGMYLGSELSGWLNQAFSKKEVGADGEEEVITNWSKFWAVPCVIASIGVVLFFFSSSRGETDTEEPAAEDEVALVQEL